MRVCVSQTLHGLLQSGKGNGAERRRRERSLRRSERRESGADFFGKNRAAIPNG
jgi:hypothetical protein